MNFLIIILIVCIITFLGNIVLNILRLQTENNGISNLSVSWGIGVGLTSLQLFIYSRLGIPWSKENILLFWFPFLIFYIFIKGIKFQKLRISFKSSLKERFFMLLIYFSALYTFSQAIIRPLTAWDTWATWLFEAKVFFIEGKIIPQLFNEFNSDYPLIFKLLASNTYIFLGKVDDTAILLVSFAFYIFLGITLFKYINYRYGRKLAIIFTFLLLTNQVMIRLGGRLEAGLADLPLAFFELITTIIILEYFICKKIKHLILANFFIGILCLIKYDGIPYALVVSIFLVYFIFKNKLYSHLWAFLFLIIPVLDWIVFRFINNLPTSYLEGHTIEISMNKTFNAFLGTFLEFINVRSWGLSWIIYFIILLFVRKVQFNLLFINSLILIQIFIYLLLYLFTYGNAPESSIQRLLAHLFPILFIYYSLILKTANQRLTKIL